MAHVPGPLRDVRGRAPAGKAFLLINLVAFALLFSACGGFDPYYPPSEDDYRRTAEIAVEKYRVTLGTIESLMPCEILGDVPASSPQDENPWVGWEDVMLVRQSVEKSWGPELADGIVGILKHGNVGDGNYRTPEVGDRGIYYAKGITTGDASFTCLSDDEPERALAGGYGFWGPAEISLEEMAEYLDEATPGDSLEMVPITTFACTLENPDCD
jgi:hypothetical protein